MSTSNPQWEKAKALMTPMFMVVVTAILGGIASYVATWNIEAQKINFEAAQKLEASFHDNFGKTLILTRKLIIDFKKERKIDEEKRQELIESIVNVQISFHIKAGRWPESRTHQASELMSDIRLFRDQIEDANTVSDLENAFNMLYPIMEKKDTLFKDIKNDSKLNITNLFPTS